MDVYCCVNREIIIMAFECPHCGFRNNELQSAGAFNEKAQTVTCKVSGKEVSHKSGYVQWIYRIDKDVCRIWIVN